jgi:hypothetical protein
VAAASSPSPSQSPVTLSYAGFTTTVPASSALTLATFMSPNVVGAYAVAVASAAGVSAADVTVSAAADGLGGFAVQTTIAAKSPAAALAGATAAVASSTGSGTVATAASAAAGVSPASLGWAASAPAPAVLRASSAAVGLQVSLVGIDASAFAAAPNAAAALAAALAAAAGVSVSDVTVTGAIDGARSDVGSPLLASTTVSVVVRGSAIAYSTPAGAAAAAAALNASVAAAAAKMASAADSGAVAAAVAAAPGGASVSRASSVGGVTVLASGGFAWPPPVAANGTNASLPCIQSIDIGGSAAGVSSGRAELSTPMATGLTAGIIGALICICAFTIGVFWVRAAKADAATVRAIAALNSERARRGAPPGAPPPPAGKPPNWSFFSDFGRSTSFSRKTAGRDEIADNDEGYDFQVKNPMRLR